VLALTPGTPFTITTRNTTLAGVLADGSPFTINLSSSTFATGATLTVNFVGLPLAGDYNFDGVIDGADFVRWRKLVGNTTNLTADGNRNGVIDNGDFDVWRAHFGQLAASGSTVDKSTVVPEPATMFLLILVTLRICSCRYIAES
jgi:hypothetical protein